MNIANRKISLWLIVIIFYVAIILLSSTIHAVREGSSKDLLSGLVLSSLFGGYFGLQGGFVGSILGSVVGLIRKFLIKKTFLPGLKFGAAFGFIGILAFWFIVCWIILESICLPQ